jgi:hypothetical protein
MIAQKVINNIREPLSWEYWWIYMRFLLVSILMILLAAGASAKPEEISVGPYNVSFDLNTTTNHSISSDWDDANATAFLNIKFTNNTRVAIAVINKTVWECSDLSPDLKYLRLALNYDKALGNMTSGSLIERIIDGRPGIVVVGRYDMNGSVFDSTIAKYWLDSKEIENYNISVAMTKVEIIARVPMNMSESLLDTIHVEAV